MQARCSVCGKEEQITKLHKDYKKMQRNPDTVYICEACNIKLTQHAVRAKDLGKGK